VRRRCQADDQQPGVRRPEPGYRPAPVRPVRERGAFGTGHLLTPGDQPGAGTAVRDAPVETGEAVGVHDSTVGAAGGGKIARTGGGRGVRVGTMASESAASGAAEDPKTAAAVAAAEAA